MYSIAPWLLRVVSSNLDSDLRRVPAQINGVLVVVDAKVEHACSTRFYLEQHALLNTQSFWPSCSNPVQIVDFARKTMFRGDEMDEVR